jgi:hypothetical protein
MSKFYIANTEINSQYLGNTQINDIKSYESQVPNTIASSSFVDFMVAPYVNNQLIDLYAGGRNSGVGSFTISSNAIQGFTNLSPITTAGTGSLSIEGISYNNKWTGSVNSIQVWDGWLFASASTWDIFGTPPAGDVLSFSRAANDVNRLSFGTNPWTTRNGNRTEVMLNPFDACFPNDNSQNQNSWNGQWVYVMAQFENFEDQQLYRSWWKTKSGVTGSSGTLYGSNPLALSSGPTFINLYGIPGMQWGVFRHYTNLSLASNTGFVFTGSIGEVNFNAEKDYFS